MLQKRPAPTLANRPRQHRAGRRSPWPCDPPGAPERGGHGRRGMAGDYLEPLSARAFRRYAPTGRGHADPRPRPLRDAARTNRSVRSTAIPTIDAASGCSMYGVSNARRSCSSLTTSTKPYSSPIGVIVMSPRPGRVQKVVHSRLGRPRDVHLTSRDAVHLPQRPSPRPHIRCPVHA